MEKNELLERIAIALERLAIALRKHEKTHTPFPWNEMSAVTFERVQRGLDKAHWERRLLNYDWPLSCEDLMEIGYSEIKDMRLVGGKSIKEIEQKLSELGFKW